MEDFDDPAIEAEEENIFDSIDLEGEDNEQDNEKIKELLFCVQGIGKFIDENKTNYEKGSYCEPSLRDIHRFLRNEDSTNPIFKYSILNWNACESDIIPCLLKYENNDKISQLCLVIIADLTEDLSETAENKESLFRMIVKLNEYLIKVGVIELYSRYLNDATQKINEMKTLKIELNNEIKKNANLINVDINSLNNDDIQKNNNEKDNGNDNGNNDNNDNNDSSLQKNLEMKRKINEIEEQSYNLIELILLLIKQQLFIFDTNDLSHSSMLYVTFLSQLSKYKILDAIMYFCSYFNDVNNYPFINTISLTLLSIIFQLTCLLTPKSIIDNSEAPEDNKRALTELQRLMQEEELEKEQRMRLKSSRPNTFGTRIEIKRPLGQSSFIATNVSELINNRQQYITEKTNTFKEQKHKAQKKSMFKNKKLPQTNKVQEVKMINDIKLREYFSKSTEIFQWSFCETLIQIKNFFIKLKKNCFNSFVYFFYFMLGREDELGKYDIYHLIHIMVFFLDFNRYIIYNKHARMENKEDIKTFDFDDVKSAISADMINYMFNYLFVQVNLSEKIDRKYYMMFSIVYYLKQILFASFDSYKFPESKDDLNLSINVVIQDHLLTKDFSKIIKELYSLYNEIDHPNEILYELIEFTEIYYSSLELFSKKRSLRIKKQRKKKKKRKEEEDEEKLLQKYVAKMNNPEESEESLSISEDEFIEKDLDIYDESKNLVQYIIIDKIISLFKDTNNFVNSFDLTKQLLSLQSSERKIIKLITRIFERIAIKAKCIWIFFQMEYLIIFDKLLNNTFFNSDKTFEGLKKLIHKITDEFFKIMQTNKMLPIECLFRFNGLALVESILNNYEGMRKEDYFVNEVQDEEDRPFVPEEGEEYYKLEKKEKLEKEKEDKEKEEHKEKVVWTMEEDKELIEQFFKNAVKDENGKIINYKNLVNLMITIFTTKTKHDINLRMKEFKLQKGEENAKKKFNEIYQRDLDLDQ